MSGPPCNLADMTTVQASEADDTPNRVQLGAMGEALAVDHLTRMGLRLLGRNGRCRYGELDVIACDAATRTVGFVEVKTRTGDGYGGLAHAVTPTKVRRLRRLAGVWLGAPGGGRGGGSGARPGCGWPRRTNAGRRFAST